MVNIELSNKLNFPAKLKDQKLKLDSDESIKIVTKK